MPWTWQTRRDAWLRRPCPPGSSSCPAWDYPGQRSSSHTPTYIWRLCQSPPPCICLGLALTAHLCWQIPCHILPLNTRRVSCLPLAGLAGEPMKVLLLFLSPGPGSLAMFFAVFGPRGLSMIAENINIWTILTRWMRKLKSKHLKYIYIYSD